ncbi:MAG: DNA polymerase III subunit gamma/tau [Oscillospiraceae bacterium]|jgi:DNA polymerase-3 subunit gamma/tau|nr:DNA polymerase III subunit gamma/tau [Oscillospiraceae bacterium]
MPNVQALYRIWRSRRFDEVVGQDSIIRTLRSQVRSGSIAHAYLFSGPRGVGKTSVAKIFARAINCIAPEDGEPCGRCSACEALVSDSNLDVLEMDAASNNKVDDARDLIERVKYPPAVTRYRVFIIDEAHMLTTPAFNALLKTLEEPPRHAVFILATTEPKKLPDTILSRCQWYAFRRITPRIIVERLEYVARRSAIQYETEAMWIIARASDGGMRDALSLLDVCKSTADGGVVTARLVRDTLGAADPEVLFALADALVDKNARAAFQRMDACLAQGLEPQELAGSLCEHARALALAKICEDDVADILAATAQAASEYKEQAQRASQESLLRMIDLFAAASQTNKWNASPRLMLERAVLRSCIPDDAIRLEELAARVEYLEDKLANLALNPAPVQQEARAVPPPIIHQNAAANNDMQGIVNDTRDAAASDTALAVNPALSPANAESSLDANDLWERTVDIIKRKYTRIYGMVRGGQPQAVNGDELQVYFDNDDKQTSFYSEMLNKGSNRQLVDQALSQAAGRSMRFVPASGKRAPVPPADNAAKLDKVFHTFGREKVDVVPMEKFGNNVNI